MIPLLGMRITKNAISFYGLEADIATSADIATICLNAADMDGDGDMDIVSASGIDDTIAWYENTGFKL